MPRPPLPARRRRLAAIAVLVTGLAASCAPRVVAPTRPGELPLVTAVTTVGMTVADVDRAVDFYSRVLGFTLVSDVEVTGADVEQLEGVFGVRVRVARMRLGDETIELTDYLAPRGRPIPPGTRSNDRTFQHVAIVTSDMARAYAHLRAHHVEHASTGPQRLPDWNPNAGGIEAFYFKDPDGHVLEAIHFPPGKGDPRWQCDAGRGVPPRPSTGDRPCPLFQGIDHTAIVVGDTARSLRFYRDVLGLRVAGSSENYGPEQAHLNNVAGAHLRITGLRARSGPGIELLEYLAPRGGKPAPADLAANDLAHWETSVATADLGAAAARLRAARVAFVSPSAVTFTDPALGFSAATMVRDPDGHALRVLTP